MSEIGNHAECKCESESESESESGCESKKLNIRFITDMTNMVKRLLSKMKKTKCSLHEC